MDTERNPSTLANPQTATRDGHGTTGARRRSRIWVPIVTLTVIILAVASALYSLNRDTIPEEIDGLIEYGNLSSSIANGPVVYAVEPPPGGEHAAASLECGIYNGPVENERAVAALATGAIWIAYDPSITEPELDNLKVFGEGEIDVFMAPYPDLTEPLVVTGWGVQLYPDSPEDPRIASFIRDYKNADSAPFSELSCRQGEEIPSEVATS